MVDDHRVCCDQAHHVRSDRRVALCGAADSEIAGHDHVVLSGDGDPAFHGAFDVDVAPTAVEGERMDIVRRHFRRVGGPRYELPVAARTPPGLRGREATAARVVVADVCDVLRRATCSLWNDVGGAAAGGGTIDDLPGDARRRACARRLHINHHVGGDRDRLTVRWVLLPRRRFELRGDTAIQARWRVRTGHRLTCATGVPDGHGAVAVEADAGVAVVVASGVGVELVRVVRQI